MTDFVTLQTNVFRELGEDSASPNYWTLAQVKAAINEGQYELAALTEFQETSESLSLTSGTQYYNLKSSLSRSDIFFVSKVYHSSTKWLFPISAQDLDNAAYIQWEKITGSAPTHFIQRGTYWVGFYPKPSANTSVTVYYSYPPADLSGNSDTPAFPPDYHYLLEKYAVYSLLCQEAEYLKAEPYYAEFLSGAEGMKRYIDNRGGRDMVPVLGAIMR